MKKLLSLVLAVLLILGMANSLAEVDKSDFHYFEDGVTISTGRGDGFKFYGYNEDWVSPEDNLWLTTMKEYLNVTIENKWLVINDTTGANQNQWNLAMASGELPTIGGVDSALYEDLIEAGYVADMTEAYELYASDYVKSLADNSPDKAYMTRDGKLLGLPQVSPLFSNFDMLIIRKDWMEAIGETELPTTIDEVIELGQKFVDAQLGGENTYALCVGGAPLKTDWGGLQGFFMGHGVAYRSNCWVLDEESGELFYGPTDARMEEALLTLQGLYADGLIKEDYLVTGAATSFNAGECGIIYSVNFGPTRAVDLLALDPEADLIAIDIPTVDGEKPIYYESAVPSKFLFVNANATDEQKRAVVELVNLTQALFADFEYDWGYHRECSPVSAQYESAYARLLYYDEIAYAYETGDTTQFTSANAKSYYERLIAYEAGDLSMAKYYGIYRVPDGTYAVMNKAYKEGRIRNTEYLAPMTASMTEYMGPLDELLVNAINKVIMGEDISVWTAAVNEWYATGGQEMTDDANAWYAAQN